MDRSLLAGLVAALLLHSWGVTLVHTRALRSVTLALLRELRRRRVEHGLRRRAG